MALADAFSCEIEPFERSVFFECQDAVFRTGGMEAAARADESTNRVLIETNESNEKWFQAKFP